MVMNLVRRRPRNDVAAWNALQEIEDHFNRVFSEPFGQLSEPRGNGSAWAPAIDVSETEDSYLVEADIPGVPKENISLEVLDDVVKISGERKSEKDETKKGIHRV
jgi:HSP20 family protein